MEVALNPLSANQQCHSVEECFAAVSSYIACCEYSLPALGSKRMTLVFDDHVEQRFLFGDQNLHASIAQCKGVEGGRDLVAKWYLYTRNRSIVLSRGDELEIGLTAQGVPSTVEGIVHKHLHDEVGFWVSFSGDAVFAANELTLSSHQRERTIKNASDIESFRAWLPSYEPNPKHREKEYVAEGGEVVSPMPLSDAEAQELLLTSLADDGGTRWAFHKRTATYYCFRRTHNDQEIFHGFTESEEKLPNNLREQLKT